MPIQDQLVYPAGEVPLKIYEKRYRHMVDDLSKEGADRIFGLVMSNKVGDICEVGTGLEVMNVKSLEDGRQLVGTASRQRFRILRLVQEEPYMVAEVEYGLIDSDVYAASDKNSGSYADGELPKHLCELEREVEANVNDVLSLLNKLIEIEAAKSRARVPRMKPSQLSSSAEMLAPSKHLFRLQVATDYSFAISNTIGGSPLVRQLLLESPTLELRLRRLRQVLLRERNFLLQQVSEGATEAFN
jgi:Lon protease-like protein